MKIIIDKINLLIFGIMLIFIFMVIFSFYQYKFSLENIHGLWKGDLNSKELIFQFNEDQTCVLSFKDNLSQSVESINGDFEMDFSKNPFSLSIRNIPQLNHPLHTIIQFLGRDSIQLAGFSPRWKVRPIAFEQDKIMSLNRFKE